MRLPSKEVIEREQLLLQQCAAGDKSAQQRFFDVSYSNEVMRAVQETLGRVGRRPPKGEVEALFTVIVGEVYEQHDALPSLWIDLRTLIRRYAVKRTRDYVRGKLAI